MGRKRTIVSRLQQRRRILLRAKQNQRSAADELPAAGSFQRIDAGLVPRDANGSCREFLRRGELRRGAAIL